MKQEQGSTVGAILLVTGCCIGAGMLGLPVLSALGGFLPSTLLFILCWLFMVTTGLLLLEINLWFKESVSLVTMAGQTLGIVGKAVTWVSFVFLFYCLMVAYGAGSGELISDFAQPFGVVLPHWVGSLSMVFLFGLMIFLGMKAVDDLNRLLMLGLVLSYALLVVLGLPHLNFSLLQHKDWGASLLVVPAMILSFGFHNLVPSLTQYLQRDVKKLRLTLVVGSAIPLLIYLVWEGLILGLVPLEGEGGFREALGQGDMATRALRNAVGNRWVVDVAHYFAFFAIVTSFLGVALSFVDFLADGLKIKKDPKGKIILCILALAPPFIFAILYPNIFLTALNYAGGVGAVVLFGILPALMVWSGRYYKKIDSVRLIPGGRIVLGLVILISCTVMILQVIGD
jgi:tyrosine-specific transport protein